MMLGLLTGFAGKHIDKIAIAVAVTVVLWGAFYFGIKHERTKWELAQAEATLELRNDLEEVRRENETSSAELEAAKARRAEISRELQDALNNADGSLNVCLDAGGVRDFNNALDKLRGGS